MINPSLINSISDRNSWVFSFLHFYFLEISVFFPFTMFYEIVCRFFYFSANIFYRILSKIWTSQSKDRFKNQRTTNLLQLQMKSLIWKLNKKNKAFTNKKTNQCLWFYFSRKHRILKEDWGWDENAPAGDKDKNTAMSYKKIECSQFSLWCAFLNSDDLISEWTELSFQNLWKKMVKNNSKKKMNASTIDWAVWRIISWWVRNNVSKTVVMNWIIFL